MSTAETLRAEIERLQNELAQAKAVKLPRIVKRERAADLLWNCRDKPVKYLVQLDGFAAVEPDELPADCLDREPQKQWRDVGPDEVSIGHVAELRRTDCVRLQIPIGTSRGVALRVLDAMRKTLASETGADFLNAYAEADAFEGVPF